MRGHLEQRGKTSWRAKIYVGVDAHGRRQYVMRTLHGTKRAAEDQLNAILTELRREPRVLADPTFADLVAKWREIGTLNLSPTTQAEYERLLEKRLMPRFGTIKLRAIRPVDVDIFYPELHRGGRGAKPLCAQSVQHVHAVLRMLLNQAVRWEWIASNAAAKASPPRVLKSEPTIPEPHDLKRILEDCEHYDPDLACFLRLSAISGARRGEVCALRWSDIDLSRGILTISRSLIGGRNNALVEKGTKTHAKRKVSLDEETIRSLVEHQHTCQGRARACDTVLPAGSFIFSDAPDSATPWRPDRVTRAFRRLADRLGVSDVRLHDLRHFAATQLLAAGVPVKTVSARLGHANASTTLNIYAHQLEAADDEAAQVLAGLLDAPRRRMVQDGQ
jgi:integrase